MRISFRQGIVSAPSGFLQVTGSGVSLAIASPAQLIVTLADGTANYLHVERSSITNAWAGPFTTGVDYWLYWDLDIRTAQRTFGVTTLEPHFSSAAPTSPANNQHWYDVSTNTMKVWNATASRWVRKIRVFAAKLEDGGTPISMSINSPSFTGTQVGALEALELSVGPIVFDTNGSPLKRNDNTFLTTEDVVTANVASSSRIKVGALWTDAVSEANIPAYSVVHFTDFHKISMATNALQEVGAYGLIEVDASTGSVVNVVTEGVVHNPTWNWTSAGVNAALYISGTGQLTATPPPNPIVVATVIDPQTILVRPKLVTVNSNQAASTSALGSVKLSVAPVAPDNPIAVGDNDPRLTGRVLKAGDTMTGPLILSGDPASDLHAATKRYVDTKAPIGYASSVGYKTLILGASTFARGHANFSVSGYARSGGTATVRISINSINDPPIVGQKARIVSSATPDIDVTGFVSNVTKINNTTYDVSIPDARSDRTTAPGTMFINLASSTNTHCWPQLLNAYCGGMLDYVNVSVGGTYTNEWLEEGRIAEVAAQGPYDIGILNFGYGNAINSHTDPAPYVVGKIFEALEIYSKLCHWCVFVSNMGTTDTGLTPTVQTYTLNSRIDSYLKREITRRFPNVSFIDVQNAAMQLATYGASTPAMINGRPPTDFLDSSGIHFTPLASETQAKAIAAEIRRLIPSITPFPFTSADNYIVNTATDYDGGINGNGLKSWDANTAVIPAVVGIINMGEIPQGMILYEDNATDGMTAAFKMENSPHGGKRLKFTFDDPIGSANGLTLGMIYNGDPSSSLTALLNNPQFQGKPCDFWIEASWANFNPGSLLAVYIQLVAKVNGVQTIIAAPIADHGVNSMGAVSATWQNGFSGILRTNHPFYIPSGVTYTNAQIQYAFRTVENAPLGKLTATWGRMQLSVRQPLL